MHLLLINVAKGMEIRIPQGLLYLASAVAAAGHTVTTHDEALVEDHQRSLETILAYNADVVGLSVYTVPWQLKRVEEISRAVKKARKSTTVMWGGWHPTLYPRPSILNENVDIVAKGPGEKLVCEVLEVLEQHRSLRGISGLLIKQDGKIIDTGPECMDPQYMYPPLDMQLIDLDAYLQHHDRGSGTLQYITTRGCHGRCRFCATAQLFNGCMIRKPKTQIVQELETCVLHHKVSTIHFSDDNTFRNAAEALELCDIIRSVTNGEVIPWRCATRIDTLSRLPDDMYSTLAASGCKGFVLGIESGVDRVLGLMSKGITVSQVRKVLRALAAHGLHVNLLFFMFGYPGETQKEAKETLALAHRARAMLPYSDVSLSVYFRGVADASWLAEDMSVAEASNLSSVFDKYYADNVRSYRLGRTRMKVLRHYFGASRRSERPRPGKLRFVRNWYRRWLLLRMKCVGFAMPFEYYLYTFAAKMVNRFRARLGSGPK